MLDSYTIKTKHSKGVSCAALVNEKILITAGYDYKIKIWDWVKRKCIKEKKVMEAATSLLIARTKESQLLISGHDSGYLLVFEIGTYKVEFSKKVAESKIICLVEIGDDMSISVGSFDGSVVIFNFVNKIIEMKFRGH